MREPKPWQAPAKSRDKSPKQSQQNPFSVCVPEQSHEVTVSLEETLLYNVKVEKKRLKQHFLL